MPKVYHKRDKGVDQGSRDEAPVSEYLTLPAASLRSAKERR
jgi:hypothetical protein